MKSRPGIYYSEWQIAQRIVRLRAAVIAEDIMEERLSKRDPTLGSDPLRKSIEGEIDSLAEHAANRRLRECLYAQNQPNFSMNETMQFDVDVKNVMHFRIGKIIEDYHADIPQRLQAKELYLHPNIFSCV